MLYNLNPYKKFENTQYSNSNMMLTILFEMYDNKIISKEEFKNLTVRVNKWTVNFEED